MTEPRSFHAARFANFAQDIECPDRTLRTKLLNEYIAALDCLGKEFGVFAAEFSLNAGLGKALAEALIYAYDDQLKISRPFRLFDLVRRLRNRIERIRDLKAGEDDISLVCKFAESIKTFDPQESRSTAAYVSP